MLSICDVTKAYAGRTLFADASLHVNPRDRIGVVGPNGAGKTTLFNLILGEESPDAGKILRDRRVNIGHLPQESAPVADETVLELATSVTPELAEIQRQIQAIEAGHPPGDTFDDDAHARFAALGGPQMAAKAKKILGHLGFQERDYLRPARELSGGWVMRVHLARLLVQEPELLLLDEPTNHLDLETLIWFQEYLVNYPGALLVISHDREFLNRLVGSIVEIRQARLIRFTGNYDDYLTQREAHGLQQEAAFKNQQREIGRLMDFVNRFRAKNTKAAQAQSKLKQIERMDKIDAPEDDTREISFRFPQPARSGQRVISLKDIHHAYGDHVVYQGMNFEAERGRRIVLVGPNGAGKSTLLKLLAGVLPVQQGEREPGYNVRTGYYSQYRVEMLNPAHTVLEEALDTPQRVTEMAVRTLLGCFLFQGDDVFKRVSVLSGGEKSRLALVKLLLDPPNLLLMDEPTTHLDMSSIDALAYALDQFEGTLIFISHDVYFIRALANHVVHVNDGALMHYPGGYDYFIEKTAAVSARAALTAGAAVEAEKPDPADRPSVKAREQKRLEAEVRQARSRARRGQQQVVDRLEAEIQQIEARQREITAALEEAETYAKPRLAGELNREFVDLQARLGPLTVEWEVEAAKLEDVGNPAK